MWLVNLALLPPALGGIYFFGWSAAPVILSAIAGAVAAESLVQYLRGAAVTVSDGSAFLTGFLLGLNMPQEIPLWLPFLGSVFAITIVKHAFGGLGNNIFNPALAGRVFLLLSYPRLMTAGWSAPRTGRISIDGVTGATPLTVWFESCRTLADAAAQESAKAAAAADISSLYSPETILSLFTGNTGGSIGETSVILLLAGAVLLLWKRCISWHIPLSFLGALGILSMVLRVPGECSPSAGAVLFQLFSGGAVLGAFFMATDMVTSPLTSRGKIIFGAGCGFLTAVIRYYAGYPEGVSFAILLMNSLTPMIDRYARPRIYGR